MKKAIVLIGVIVILACSKSGEEQAPEIIQQPEPNPPIGVANTAPSVPNKIFPTNGSLCIDNPLEFSWGSATDNEGDTISYELELATDNSFNNIIEKRTVTETSATISLEPGIQVNWRVRAKDSRGEYSDYSSIWNFYTEGEAIANYLPFSPTLIYPKEFSFVQGNSLMLEWSSSDVDQDSLTYDIYFGDVNPPPLVYGDSADSVFEVYIVSNNTYYWKIVVKDSRGGVSIGDVWSFKS